MYGTGLERLQEDHYEELNHLQNKHPMRNKMDKIEEPVIITTEMVEAHYKNHPKNVR